MKSIRPYGDNILVRFDHHDPSSPLHPSNRKTTGGLFVPENVAAADPVETVTATVVAAGPGKHDELGRFIPTDPALKAGARVLVEGKSHAAILCGQPVFLEGVEHRMIRAHELGAVIG